MLVLGIESSCDETGVALYDTDHGLQAQALHSQVAMHNRYGGVVPELASRDHVERLVPLLEQVMADAQRPLSAIDAIAYTQGPGLAGALLVGASVATALAMSLDRPVIGVHHLEGHLLSPLLSDDPPEFPFVALLVSGGHTQLLRVDGLGAYTLLGETVDDAAGEAFDKCAKVMGLGYPGGPVVNRLANEGNPKAFAFSKPNVPGYDYSFSGLKTSFLYTLRDELEKNPNFIEERKADLCASLQATVIDILMKKLRQAAKDLGIDQVALAGGVSANTGLRAAFEEHAKRYGWKIFIPKFAYTTDNAAMVAMNGYFSYMEGRRAGLDAVPFARVTM